MGTWGENRIGIGEMTFKLPETRDGDKEKGEERRHDEKFKEKEKMKWWV